MARIRTIKPEFFRHEGLQDLESQNVGRYPMMVFSGLWGHCDSKGRFKWQPRQLKLDILPFLSFDMAETLSILQGAGFLVKYEVDGKTYGEIPSFNSHQVLSGKESTDGVKFPERKGSVGEILGSVGEIQESQEGKGREGEKEGLTPHVVEPDGSTPNGGDSAFKFPKTDQTPYSKIVDLYHEVLPQLPRVFDLTAKRKAYIRARWLNIKPASVEDGLHEFKCYFNIVAESKFLTGLAPANGSRKVFKADLEWLVTEGNFIKVLERKYA